MKIKVDNIEFVSFSDGVCNIYTEDDTGENVNKYENLGFNNRILGFTRFFQADANKMAVDKVIRIPKLEDIDTYDHVSIEGVEYDIKLIQDMYNTNPQSRDLTLQLR